jgi:nitrile hydratase
VANASVDPAYGERLLANGTRAVHELGIEGPEIDHLTVVANSPDVNHVVVSLCSCYPWGVLGLRPNRYKDPSYRARMVVREPRVLLAEMAACWTSPSRSRPGIAPQRCGTSC